MNTSERRPGERVRDVRCTEDVLIVDLLEGLLRGALLREAPRRPAGQRAVSSLPARPATEAIGLTRS
jgi:hypothetical protein